MFSFAAWMFYGLVFACHVILRFTRPELERPYKVLINLMNSLIGLSYAHFTLFERERFLCVMKVFRSLAQFRLIESLSISLHTEQQYDP